MLPYFLNFEPYKEISKNNGDYLWQPRRLFIKPKVEMNFWNRNNQNPLIDECILIQNGNLRLIGPMEICNCT